MLKVTTAKCPNCGADIELDNGVVEYVCKYCGSTILIENDVARVYQKRAIEKDEIDEKCGKVSEKFNTILKYYIGNKNEMLLMLKDRVGLVSSGKTLAKYNMMKNSPSYTFEKFTEAFTYRIGDRVLDHFEYKRDGSIEVTYDTEDVGFFAVEYYGLVTKYQDIGELLSVLDTIIEEVKQKFQQ